MDRQKALEAWDRWMNADTAQYDGAKYDKKGWKEAADAESALAEFDETIRAALSGPGWMPIETRPMDGTWILVWNPKLGHQAIARNGNGGFPCEGDWDYEHVDATHWQPLPAAPQDKGE